MISERKASVLEAWKILLEDRGYRADSPDAWHQALLDAAENMLRSGVIDQAGWLELKDQANAAYERAIEETVAAKGRRSAGVSRQTPRSGGVCRCFTWSWTAGAWPCPGGPAAWAGSPRRRLSGPACPKTPLLS